MVLLISHATNIGQNASMSRWAGECWLMEDADLPPWLSLKPAMSFFYGVFFVFSVHFYLCPIGSLGDVLHFIIYISSFLLVTIISFPMSVQLPASFQFCCPHCSQFIYAPVLCSVPWVALSLAPTHHTQNSLIPRYCNRTPRWNREVCHSPL